jgi:YbgC/YbaW family acyl-CoA thioester hydrolase
MMKEIESERTYKSVFTIDKSFLDNYGHVNNARYLDLFEMARWEVLDQNLMGREFVADSATGPVILEVTVRFSREIGDDETITVETRSRRKDDRIFYFDQVMKNKSGEICSKALFTAALFDMKTRKMIRADEQWLKAFGF